MSTLVFRGATVVDGTGAAGYLADVEVADGRIAAIGDGLDGDRVIDADGLVLAPGFIDMHAHSDVQILARPDHRHGTRGPTHVAARATRPARSHHA